jgi:hypothetical protein
LKNCCSFKQSECPQKSLHLTRLIGLMSEEKNDQETRSNELGESASKSVDPIHVAFLRLPEPAFAIARLCQRPPCLQFLTPAATALRGIAVADFFRASFSGSLYLPTSSASFLPGPGPDAVSRAGCAFLLNLPACRGSRKTYRERPLTLLSHPPGEYLRLRPYRR